VRRQTGKDGDRTWTTIINNRDTGIVSVYVDDRPAACRKVVAIRDTLGRRREENTIIVAAGRRRGGAH